MEPGGDRTATGQRLTLAAAADALGITVEAVRSRLKRGTLQREKGEDGTTYVIVEERQGGDRARQDGDGSRDRSRQDGDRADPLFERMASEIDHLREQLKEQLEANRENRRIIAGLVQRVPELEAAPETRESTQTAPEDTGDGAGRDDQPERRSWWRAFFGLE